MSAPAGLALECREAKIDWPYVLNEARSIVASYETPVTLRQLFYRLVSRLLIPNTQNAYKALRDRKRHV